MARHEVSELEPLGLDHRDLQPAVEHLDSVFDELIEVKSKRNVDSVQLDFQ